MPFSLGRYAMLLTALAVLSLAPAKSADDTATAQAIITAQTDAFARDDAAAAYALASPQIQQLFPQPDAFMGMVRGSYAPVYRHKRFEFGAAATTPDGKLLQRVGIVDKDDVAWEGLYTVERQSDGTLKITGCVLLKVGQAV